VISYETKTKVAIGMQFPYGCHEQCDVSLDVTQVGTHGASAVEQDYQIQGSGFAQLGV
jgi:hypothetical protein